MTPLSVRAKETDLSTGCGSSKLFPFRFLLPGDGHYFIGTFHYVDVWSVWAAVPEYQAECLTNSRNPFLTVLEPGSLTSGCRHGRVRALFQVTGSLYPHVVAGAGALLASPIRTLIPRMSFTVMT